MTEPQHGKTGKTRGQLLRYALVGLLSNVSGYLVYLLVTYLGTPPKIAMTLLYAVGALLGFLGNRSVTFRHDGNAWSAGARYLVAHLLGYLANLAMLIVFVDRLGYPHQVVQAAAVFVVAGMLFLMFKYFVFHEQASQAPDARA